MSLFGSLFSGVSGLNAQSRAMGMISDKIGRRKPVIIAGGLVVLACLAWILYGPADVLPPYLLALVAGTASGAAMLPYTVIKEANPPEYSGTATGVINFLNFTFSALLGPVFGWIFQSVSGHSGRTPLEVYQQTFQSLLYGVALAILLLVVVAVAPPRQGIDAHRGRGQNEQKQKGLEKLRHTVLPG